MGRHRKVGRPKGSKNKPGHKAGRPRKDIYGAISRAKSLDESEFRRLRGRPRKIQGISSTNAEVLFGMLKNMSDKEKLKFMEKLLS